MFTLPCTLQLSLFFTRHRNNLLRLDRFKVAGVLVIKLSTLFVLRCPQKKFFQSSYV